MHWLSFTNVDTEKECPTFTKQLDTYNKAGIHYLRTTQNGSKCWAAFIITTRSSALFEFLSGTTLAMTLAIMSMHTTPTIWMLGITLVGILMFIGWVWSIGVQYVFGCMNVAQSHSLPNKARLSVQRGYPRGRDLSRISTTSLTTRRLHSIRLRALLPNDIGLARSLSPKQPLRPPRLINSLRFAMSANQFAAWIVVLLTPLITYCLSHVIFKIKVRSGAGEPPIVPHLFPFLSHTRIFALGDNLLASTFLKQCRPGTPVRFRGIGFDFVLVSGAHLIRKAMLSSGHLDFNQTSATFFRRLFNAPKRICDATLADDSGVGAKPYPGSSVHPGRRLIRNQVLFFNDAFSKPSMDELIPRFLRNLEQRCTEVDVDEDWVRIPDLYAFLSEFVLRCGIRSFNGNSMLELNPGLEKDFTDFNNSVAFLATDLPRWMKPSAFESRAKCLAAVKRWRREAERRSEKAPEQDTEWDSAWGLGAIRRRNNFNWNVIPAAFWWLFEVLRDEDLSYRARAELEATHTLNSPFDPTRILDSPLLQSTYAETLRLHSASLITRTVKKTHALDSWILKLNHTVLVSSHVEHCSPYWNTVDSSGGNHPPEEFWAERFLVQDGDTTQSFSLDGMGEHICPGRHFAKHEMFLTLGVFMTRFDIELLTPRDWRPDNDLTINDAYEDAEVNLDWRIPPMITRGLARHEKQPKYATSVVQP
ncbi:cytochrome P450 [Bimuria novae-zelandiae CBS 107.79]|uniref:Cytochrome P450 n=1 Tax=Bimuria novae-zelandiae CBS 107.79 TaxID=1447943 RepID=A0A6A5VVX2_9PLEO|nr:cytochrome P450 [Bimuria novae-zelandiae CBS 107.79]